MRLIVALARRTRIPVGTTYESVGRRFIRAIEGILSFYHGLFSTLRRVAGLDPRQLSARSGAPALV